MLYALVLILFTASSIYGAAHENQIVPARPTTPPIMPRQIEPPLRPLHTYTRVIRPNGDLVIVRKDKKTGEEVIVHIIAKKAESDNFPLPPEF